MEALAPLEITALAKIADQLDYYQLLHLERDATPKQLKQAYHATSRTFHPDANRNLPTELRDSCQRIAKRLTEAYCVLRDPRRRRVYDDKLASGQGGLRMQLAEARAAHRKRETETREGRTPQGRQFFRRALEDLGAGRGSSAVSNLQTALTFEPDNPLFQQKLEEARKQRD